MKNINTQPQNQDAQNYYLQASEVLPLEWYEKDGHEAPMWLTFLLSSGVWAYLGHEFLQDSSKFEAYLIFVCASLALFVIGTVEDAHSTMRATEFFNQLSAEEVAQIGFRLIETDERLPDNILHHDDLMLGPEKYLVVISALVPPIGYAFAAARLIATANNNRVHARFVLAKEILDSNQNQVD